MFFLFEGEKARASGPVRHRLSLEVSFPKYLTDISIPGYLGLSFFDRVAFWILLDFRIFLCSWETGFWV